MSSRMNGFAGNISLDPANGTAREVSPLPDAAYHDFNCPSVLLPLVPDDDYRPRVLLAGGARSQLIDLGQANPNWVDVPRLSNIMMAPGTTVTALWRSNDTHLDLFATSTNGDVWSTFWETTSGWQPWFQIHPESRARTHSCATLLPTGDVLLTGGAAPDNDQAGVMEPELYSAPIDRWLGRYLPSTGVWQRITDPAKVLRNYHSTALLMPDCRVWTAGGNSPNQPDQPPTAVQEQVEIYEPPYPAGPRPTITAYPSSARYSSDFTVAVSGAPVIAATLLMRCGSSTHAFDANQRAVLLHFQTTGANTLIVTAPPSGTVAPPSPYMLFVVDDGRPYEYAKFIQVGG